jgi:hypothetical protein
MSDETIRCPYCGAIFTQTCAHWLGSAILRSAEGGLTVEVRWANAVKSSAAGLDHDFKNWLSWAESMLTYTHYYFDDNWESWIDARQKYDSKIEPTFLWNDSTDHENVGFLYGGGLIQSVLYSVITPEMVRFLRQQGIAEIRDNNNYSVAWYLLDSAESCQDFNDRLLEYSVREAELLVGWRYGYCSCPFCGQVHGFTFYRWCEHCLKVEDSGCDQATYDALGDSCNELVDSIGIESINHCLADPNIQLSSNERQILTQAALEVTDLMSKVVQKQEVYTPWSTTCAIWCFPTFFFSERPVKSEELEVLCNQAVEILVGLEID